jgi:shikimate 5-dehydrogenase
VVNATPLAEELPFAVGDLRRGDLVADLAYVPEGDTALVAAARRGGLTAIDGRQVLAAEVGAQFRLMTGEPLPGDAARLALG